MTNSGGESETTRMCREEGIGSPLSGAGISSPGDEKEDIARLRETEEGLGALKRKSAGWLSAWSDLKSST